MRFEKIEISNYRQYESLVLTFPSKTDLDLHVVIASNGIGKTNLLNAIDWCLYGEESHLGDKDDSLSICNLKAIDKALEEGKSETVVSVKIYAKEKDESIIFERSVIVNPNTLLPGIEKFQVIDTPASGNSSIEEGETAAEIVDKYLPKKIKQYFFFDGEQLYNYFGKGQDTTHVKDSIHEIAQINLVTHVREHLNTAMNEKQREISKLNPSTEKYQNELDDLIETKENRERDIQELTNSVQEADDTIDELTTKIAGTEQIAEDDKRYKKIEEELQSLDTLRETQEKELKDLVKKYYVYLMMFDINQRTSKYIEEKESQGYLPPDINKDLISKSIKENKCVICDQDINDNIQQHLLELIKKFEVSTSVSNKLMEIKNDTYSACKKAKQYEDIKTGIYDRKRDTEDKIEELDAEGQQLYKKISTCSSVEEIKDWMDQRERLKALKSANTEKIGSYKNECEQLEKRIELKKEQIEAATKGEKKSKELKDQLKLIKEAFGVVKSVEDEVILEVRQKMEEETFEIFSELIWKTNTYGRIELSNDYRLRLFHVHGDSCLGSCSAAERELLALAFTLALHKVSHHDSLLFIDTPVGRVSDDNREHFAKSLISVSKEKQLILAFTPSEYSAEIQKYFNNAASSFNRLETNDEIATVAKGGI